MRASGFFRNSFKNSSKFYRRSYQQADFETFCQNGGYMEGRFVQQQKRYASMMKTNLLLRNVSSGELACFGVEDKGSCEITEDDGLDIMKVLHKQLGVKCVGYAPTVLSSGQMNHCRGFTMTATVSVKPGL